MLFSLMPYRVFILGRLKTSIISASFLDTRLPGMTGKMFLSPGAFLGVANYAICYYT